MPEASGVTASDWPLVGRDGVVEAVAARLLDRRPDGGPRPDRRPGRPADA